MEEIESIWEQDINSMDNETKIEKATKHKDLGKEHFLSKNYEKAFRHFTHAIKYLILIDPDTSKSTDTALSIRKEMLHTLYNNTAACHIHKGNWEHAIDLCNSVLEEEPSNTKALFRRATAFIEIQEYEKAKQDLIAVQSAEPNNLAVQRKIQILNEKVKTFNRKTGIALMKMFQT